MTVADGFVDRVNVEAKEIHPGKLILVAFAAVFFAIGWVLAKLVLAIAWTIAAVKVGWFEAGGPGRKTKSPSRRAG